MTDGDSKRAQALAAQQNAATEKRKQEVEEKYAPFHAAGSVGRVLSGLRGIVKHNDASWYKHFDGGDYFGKLSFMSPNHYASYSNAAGGFMVIGYVPSIGSHTGTSPIGREAVNKALLEMQQKVRQVNAGAKNYEPSDMGVMVMGFNEIVALYGELARIYGCLNSVKPKNFWSRESAIEALTGDSYTAVAQQAESIYFELVRAKAQIANVPLPIMPLYQRTWLLSSALFRDEKLDRSKIIAYKREAWGYYLPGSLGANQLGSRIHFEPFGTGGTGYVSDLRAALRVAIANLTNATDFVTIMGDIAKAYGFTDSLPDIPIDYEVPILDDDTTLTQIDNTMLVGKPLWAYASQQHNCPVSFYDFVDVDGELHQGWTGPTGGISAGPTFLKFNGYEVGETMLDAPVDDPTSDDVLVLTRNAMTMKYNPLDISTLQFPLDQPGDTPTSPTSLGIVEMNNSGLQPSVAQAVVTFWGNAQTGTINVQNEVYSGSEIFTRVVVVQGYTGPNATGFAAYDYDGSYSTSVPNGFYAFTEFAHKPIFHMRLPNNIATNAILLTSVANNAISIQREELARLHWGCLFSEFTAVGGSSVGSGRKSRSRNSKR